jgi:hypothetical protein
VENISVRPMFAMGVVGLVVGLGFCDGWLLIHSMKQDAVIAKINAERQVRTALQGEKIIGIEGFSLKDGHPTKIDLGPSSRVALLVFREGCHFCAANWKNWEGLFETGSLDMNVILITADKSLSQSYLDSHPLLRQKEVVLGVSPAVLDSLNLEGTPQTIFVVDGKIMQNWIGVLSEEDLKNIKQTVSRS